MRQIKSAVAPTFEWSNKLLYKKIARFVRMWNVFCIEHEMPAVFENFLFYEFNGIVGPTYQLLYTAPKEYLANSKAFKKLYYQLDKDFQNDIFTAKEYRDAKRELQINHELKQHLQKIMRGDSLN